MDGLIYQKQGEIAVFTLNRPEKYNALTPDMLRLMESSLIDFMEDTDLRVGIFIGKGEKAFCSGADVLEMLPFVKATADCPWQFPKTLMRGLTVTKPLIAAVNGLAYGGGAELAMACDLRIAADTAEFRFPEPSLGLIPRLGGTQRLPRLVGLSRAMEILLTNQRVSADTALSIGLVNRVVPREQLMDSALSMAEQICRLAPLSVKTIKRCVYEGGSMSLADGLALENDLGLQLFRTEDYAEGSAAFREKRKPKFKGK